MTALRAHISTIDRPTWMVLAAWTLVFICVPILLWNFGQPGLTVGIAAGVLAQVGAALFVTARAWGIAPTLRTVAVVLVCAWAMEFIGHTTGFPFGSYDYTERFQPQLGGVPLLIPLAWLMMLPPSWAVARAITGQASGPAFVAMTAIAITAWDLFLDPQMVNWDVWRWADPGPFHYFGIPWVNFAGWLLTASLITVLARPRALPVPALLAIYAITWALQLIGQLCFWALPGSALVGGLIMGGVLAWALLRARRVAA
jgi:putative membrane protein